jgi:hypothetical protein
LIFFSDFFFYPFFVALLQALYFFFFHEALVEVFEVFVTVVTYKWKEHNNFASTEKIGGTRVT